MGVGVREGARWGVREGTRWRLGGERREEGTRWEWGKGLGEGRGGG